VQVLIYQVSLYDPSQVTDSIHFTQNGKRFDKQKGHGQPVLAGLSRRLGRDFGGLHKQTVRQGQHIDFVQCGICQVRLICQSERK
jgi:hypothetical protein